MPHRRTLAVALAACLTVACASSSTTPTTGAAPAPKPDAGGRPRQDQQLITRDVIVGTEYTNLFDVIQALRSNWLQVKAASGFSKGATLQVYLDNQRIGGVEELRRIAPSSVLSVRFYDPIAAAARWGMDHGAGAIYVLTSNK